MYDYLRELFQETFRVDGEVEPGKSFADLDIDSLTTAEICANLEDRFKVTIDDEEVTPQTTVDELAELLRRKGAVVSA
ncbi:acyl carrier protein [Amycolatopsis plumensis]|uniref:Acyl carrier protein n=1 Tax=Amycolatopsis plumensis TaxID=236508 RepID=A0ABV5UDK2_9PSEU